MSQRRTPPLEDIIPIDRNFKESIGHLKIDGSDALSPVEELAAVLRVLFIGLVLLPQENTGSCNGAIGGKSRGWFWGPSAASASAASQLFVYILPCNFCMLEFHNEMAY